MEDVHSVFELDDKQFLSVLLCTNQSFFWWALCLLVKLLILGGLTNEVMIVCICAISLNGFIVRAEEERVSDISIDELLIPKSGVTVGRWRRYACAQNRREPYCR